MLQPAVNFRQQTLARLPAPRQRLYMGIIVYFMILAGGLIPLAAIALLALQLVPVLAQPVFWRSLWQGAIEFGGLLRLTVTAFVSGAVQVLGQQPQVLGWFVALSGVVALWVGVYGRLVLQGRRLES